MAEEIVIPELSDPRAEVGKVALANTDAQEEFRDSPEFEELEAEFRKMEIDGPSAVNWKMLNEKTVDVLMENSKDLVLATRLAYGLFLEEDFKGLAIGVKILEDMSKDHWEDMTPPVRRERGRAGAFDWFAEKLGSLIEGKTPEGDQGLAALQAHDYLLELDTALEQKFTKSQAALGPLIRALRPIAKNVRSVLEEEARKKAEAEAAAKAAEEAKEAGVGAAVSPASEAASGSAPANAAAAAEPAAGAVEPAQSAAPAPQTASPNPSAVPIAVPEVAVDGDADAAFTSLFNAAGKVASSSRQHAPQDPRGYLCARFAVWGRITVMPPVNGGKSSLPPPQKNRIAELQALKGAGNHLGLIQSAEGAFMSSPFWIDAHFMICEAMSALGSDYDAARLLVEGELAGFLKRLPDVLGLSFSDGTPFASGETKAWINESVAAGGGASGGADPLTGAASTAASLAQAGKVVEGLAVLKDYCAGCRAERDWFRGQLKLSELCLQFDVLQPLVAQLSRLRKTAEDANLAAWEPDLVVELARLSWRSLNHKNIRQVISDNDLVPLKASVMETLSILDLGAAAELTGKR
ncbi:TssA family type VI secretion system protein [Roseibium alexandrii]|uniref:TssA family type VI secretion system protein n=1 Tax=Roseibium alexandrii TaxID=388408 RepID=UPI00375179E8